MGYAKIGYVGFSNTYMTVDGATDLGMTNIWPVIGQYSGCTVADWAYPSRPDFFGDCWEAFYDNGFDPFPAVDAWWFQVGTHLDERTNIEPEHFQINKVWTTQAIVNGVYAAITRILAIANVPLYLSPVQPYLPGTNGYDEIAWRECAEAVRRVLLIASEFQDVEGAPCFGGPFPDGATILEGPTFPALTADELKDDGIHPTDAARLILGQVLKDWPAFQP